ncbi:MAG: T9SS type A sorting domain-containing protein, partial [Ignavibacteria bacterium]|nr:T9SS type A sorting domain-containing protein [Ignavibacteria bacterium]
SLTGWTRFLPDEPEAAGNIPTFSVIQGTGNDSGYFYLFGGYRNSNAIPTVRRYAFKPVNPIGIINTTEIPQDFKLYQNYPNPFNPSTTINFGLPKASHVKLFVTDAVGREITVLVNEFKNAGVHTVNFDGSKFSSGIYFYSIIADGFRETRKMLLVK